LISQYLLSILTPAMTQSQFATSFDGARIAYRVYGRGEPTVFLSNGIGCNQAFVDRVIKALATRYRVVIWDYRGHVDSEKPKDPRDLTVDWCIKDMRAVATAAGLEEVVLCGFSMGVQISLEYFQRYPENVRGFIALLGTYEYPLSNFFYMGRLGEPLVKTILKLVRLRPAVFQRVWHLALSGPWAFQAARLFVLNRKAACKSDFDNWRSHLAGFDFQSFLQLAVNLGGHSAEHILPLVNMPCLIVAGEKDNFTPVRVIRKMYEKIAGAEWFGVPQGTHGGLFEFPELINPRVLEFMRKHF